MTAAKQIELVSVEDYLAGELASDVKHEYSGGFVYAMAGARNVHNRIATDWLLSVGGRLQGKPCQAFNSDTKVASGFRRIRGSTIPTAWSSASRTGRRIPSRTIPSSSPRWYPRPHAELMKARSATLTWPYPRSWRISSSKRIARGRSSIARTDNGFVAEAYEGMDAVIPLDAVEVELALTEVYERVTFGKEDDSNVENGSPTR